MTYVIDGTRPLRIGRIYLRTIVIADNDKASLFLSMTCDLNMAETLSLFW